MFQKKDKAKEKEQRAREKRRLHRSSHRRLLRFFSAVIIVTLAFVLGFFLRSQTALMESWGIPLSNQEASSLSTTAPKSTYDSIGARVNDVEDILASYSLDEVNLDDATFAMLADLMKSTGDQYAAYYNPDVYASYVKETAERNYGGIGVLFSDYNGRAYVADVFEGSEAEAKGVAQGDYVSSIDGTSTADWSMTEVVNALAASDEDTVTITWMRPASLDAQTGTEFTTTLTYKDYREANLTTRVTDKVGVIKLRQITQNSAELVGDAVKDLTRKGARAFVLDLRDNPGGYLTQAVDIAGLFVPSGVLVEIETVEGTTSKAASGTTVTDAPVVVLVNGYTAAAAEVLAAALQDNERALVVGQTSLGKGSVQVVRELEFGGAVRYTAAYYLTPQGHDIDGVGVIPQTVVNNDRKKSDTQLLVALESARSQIQGA